MPSHLKAVFCPRNRPAPHSQPQALSFITCEGLILSAAVAWLFINHSPGPIKWWLMVDAALSGHPSGAGSRSRVGWGAVRCLCVHKHGGVLYMGYTPCHVTLCQASSAPAVQHIVPLPPTLSDQEQCALSLTLIWSSSCDLGTIHFCSMTQNFLRVWPKLRHELRRRCAVTDQQYHEWKGVCGERRLQVGEGGGRWNRNSLF